MPDRVRQGARLLIAAVLLGATARARAAAAADPADHEHEHDRDHDLDRLIGGSSTCPLPAAVRAEVETLVPRDRLNARLRAISGPTGVPIEIIDNGVPFKVIAAGSVREYRDEGRDCGYRARVAAVFVALVIDPAAMFFTRPPTPAAVATATPAPAPVPAPTPPAAPAATVTPHPGARLDLGAGVEAGWGPNARVGEAGVLMRLALGGGRIAFTTGVAALAPVNTTVGGLRLRQWRLPADIGVRAQGQRQSTGRPLLEPYGELGIGVALLTETASDLETRSTRTSLELGLRAAVGLRLASPSRVTPFAVLHAVLVPSPPTIFALPRGAVGDTPNLWIGATVGASWGFL